MEFRTERRGEDRKMLFGIETHRMKRKKILGPIYVTFLICIRLLEGIGGITSRMCLH